MFQFLTKALWTMANSEPPCSQPSETFAIRETFFTNVKLKVPFEKVYRQFAFIPR